jgi:gas vesicle protein
MDQDRILSFVVGLLSGSIVGAAVVILVTPQSGTDLRKSVADKAAEIRDAGRQAVQERRQTLTEEYKARIQIPLHPPEKEPTQST